MGKTTESEEPDEGRSANGVQAVDRVVRALEILAKEGSAAVGDMADRMGVHKSTASRILGALETHGFVQQSTRRGKYQLGVGLLRVASSIPRRLSLVHTARPVLEDLAQRYGETVNLAVRRDVYAVNVDQALGAANLASYDWIGNLTPLYATSSGKVFLAYLHSSERDQLLERVELKALTPHTLDREQLERELPSIVERGYASTHGELEDGLNAIAAPIFGHTGDLIGAVSVSGPAFRFDPSDPGVINAVVAAGEEITELMGGPAHAE
ncbi:IclR family transcriptional regulator [Sinomonas sp. ASV322]|uniref:IclR family transcriptional regulator n=1 Tax=Sinomonas sp. ASV322 TaxID=3041920 RepID=UPI0027DE580A|nr:IclR family transcriptional regulator [Sinomonas sp. ASV322]MDQ4502388.1 IclR family transcriptional regulator [Sinomonas sp. ASV322]